MNDTGATNRLLTQDPSVLGDPGTPPANDDANGSESEASKAMSVDNENPSPCATGPPNG